LPETDLKLIALEQQPAQRLQHILTNCSETISYPNRKSIYKKKNSLPSTTKSTSRNVFSASPRRYTVIPPPDIADKFWVPPDIALNSKLEKQRRSLPTSHQNHNQMFKELVDKEIQEDSQGKY
jgi:hypothetical protein